MDRIAREGSPDSPADDSPEREQSQRRSRRGLLRNLLLALVVFPPAAASWEGLTAAGRDLFGLGGWAFLVPLVLDAAAVFVAQLAMEDVLAGDSALVNRGLIWLYVAGSAGINIYRTRAEGQSPASAFFFAAASVSCAILFDRVLKRLNRNRLRKLGAMEAPLPNFRALRWVFSPIVTLSAYRLAAIEGITAPADALAYRRAIKRDKALRYADPLRVVAFVRATAGTDQSFADWARSGLPQVEGEQRLALPAGDQVDEVTADEPDGADEVLDVAGDQDESGDAETGAVDALDDEPAEVPESERLALVGLSKKAVALRGLAALGADLESGAADELRSRVPAVIAWARARGVSMDRSYGYDVVRRHLADRDSEQLRAASGQQPQQQDQQQMQDQVDGVGPAGLGVVQDGDASPAAA